MQASILFVTLIFIAVIGAGSGRDYVKWAKHPKPETPGAAYEASQEVICEITDRYIVACYPGNTCCRLANGQYGCCSVPNAVCCSDGINCCPSGYSCSLATGECHQ